MELIKITDAAEFYSGCYCRAVVKASAYEMADKSGVKLYLQMIQKIRDGEEIGGRAAAEDAFGLDDAEDMEDADLLGSEESDDEDEEPAPKKKKKKAKAEKKSKSRDDDDEDEDDDDDDEESDDDDE